MTSIRAIRAGSAMLLASLAPGCVHNVHSPVYWACEANASVGNAKATSTQQLTDDGTNFGQIYGWRWTVDDGAVEVSMLSPDGLFFWVTPKKAIRRDVGAVELRTPSEGDRNISDRRAGRPASRRYILHVPPEKAAELENRQEGYTVVIRDRNGRVDRAIFIDAHARQQGMEALRKATARSHEMTTDYKNQCRPEPRFPRPLVIT